MYLPIVKQHPARDRACAVVLVTAEFLSGLARALTATELELATLKQRLANKGICHLHDYVDANEVMLEAVARSFDTDKVDLEDDFTAKLINDVWVEALDTLSRIYGRAG